MHKFTNRKHIDENQGSYWNYS